jgi:Ca2+-binding RTX toxin-like protein
MYGTRFRRRGGSRPESTLGGRSRRLLLRPAAYAILATAVCLAAATLPSGGKSDTANAAAGPVGSGFTVTPADLAFILKQIKIAERHSRAFEGNPDPGTPVNPDPVGDPDYCQSLVGPNVNQVPDRLTTYGLRTVDGSCNNLFPGREKFAAADQPFPRLTTPVFSPAENTPPGFGPPGPSSYAQKKGNVFDSQPRLISNLIVDQTSTNPAAVAAAGFPVRSQGSTGVFVCGNPGAPAPPDCVPEHKTLFIENVTTDVGLSPPYNSLFTFFGQFFDHGVDQTVKSGGAVFVPLRADDPLITVGPDGIAGTGDEVPPSQAFMVLTRAQNQPGPDGILGDDPSTATDESADDIQNANNTDSPWVDQSQTYTSHSSHQVFLREYDLNDANHPVSTGKLLGGLDAGQTYLNSPDGRTGIGTWKAVKIQAATKLGLLLVDTDATNIPMIAADPYGKFIPGPLRGLPQYVTTSGLVEGNLASPVPVPANVRYFDTPFLTDIAHNADPSPQDTDHNPGTPPVAPTPDLDDTPSADFANQPAGTYDDEMLNAHFSCGDGRCNENIALSTIHQIFHSEHDRLVDYIKGVLTADTSSTGVTALAQWKLPVAQSPSGWNGERLFQAARFVTEMEYQHLVFEEFARKVQPAVRPFHVYSPDINPAVEAEFAHAVYRFGHSMLDDDVARTTTNPDGSKTDNSTPLLNAFLNPPEYFNNGQGGFYTPQQAAGAIVMGSSDQVGNELDEFVTETLRNNLLGLPLDLPTLNLTRAREAGVPPLNEVRRQIHAETNDAQLAPYTSWADFGQHLKHPESLINFVAAYGTHPTIRDSGPDGVLGNGDDVTTIAAKRAAARAIVDPLPTDTPPADAADFMFSNGPVWGNDANGVTNTGLDKVDLWVGGLAEVTNLFGGLLGTTFNYVFQNQLEKLQDGDRLYYLARTPGLNLRAQLEGNSFAELVQRNTDGANSLKADAFATADCRFQLANLDGTAAGYALHGFVVADDPSTPDCNETLLLMRMPDGTIAYRQRNTVDPSGINGQSVYNGTPGVDRVAGGNDNDTIWGAAGNDRIEGNGGDDVVLGGDGNDIVTDLDGADTLKGGPGNDAMDAGPGNDIVIGADGQDFLNGGANDNEVFGGPGNDFIIAGQGADAVFGDGGSDWIQGGTGQDLLQGDHGAPFFDDPAQVAPGNDIFIGQPGENDYDTEGGDDLMAQNAAIDRNAGAGGFDWAFHQYNTAPADDDMEINNNLVGLPIQVVVNRDRWQETEADSGSSFDDVIKGTETAPNTVGGAGFTGCDVLDQAGVDRIAGLNAIVPQPLTESSATVVANSAAGFCPVTGPVFGAGDILLGGPGNDTITGRGADDIIDGDRELTVRISVRDNLGTEIGSTDLMEHPALTGNFGPGSLPGMTLQEAVFNGVVDPGNLVAVREIKTPSPNNSTDTAVFRNPRNTYTITHNANGSITVDNQGGTDGIDTLWNIEQLQFSDTTIPATVSPTNTPATGTVTLSPTNPTAGAAVTVSASLADADGGVNVSTVRFNWQSETTPGVWANVASNFVGDTFIPGNAEVGLRLRVVATFLDNAGNAETIISAPTSPVAAPLTPLAAPASLATPLAGPPTALVVTVRIGSDRIAVHGTSQARLLSVVSSASGKVRARFVFSPRGIKFHGWKTIVRGRDAGGHIVLTVVVRGDATHGYQLRAVNGGKQSAKLKLNNQRVVLVATLSPGIRPALTRAH